MVPVPEHTNSAFFSRQAEHTEGTASRCPEWWKSHPETWWAVKNISKAAGAEVGSDL